MGQDYAPEPQPELNRPFTRYSRARFPASWNQLAEKESCQINMLEQILRAEVFNFSGICSSLFRPGLAKRLAIV
jgi:hypothetical protein